MRRWAVLRPDAPKLHSLSVWVQCYPSTLLLLSLLLSANAAGSFLFSTVEVVGISAAALSCSLVLLDTDDDWEGVMRNSGVRFSFTARLCMGFLGAEVLKVIWHDASSSALCFPWGTWELLGSGLHAVDTEAALCSIKLSLFGRLRVTAGCEVLQAATFNEAEFLTLICVLVEGPENLIGLGPTLHGM